MDQQDIDSTLSSVRSITVHEIEENFGRQVITERQTVKDSDIVIGAHVRLNRGKTGIIRVRVSVEFICNILKSDIRMHILHNLSTLGVLAMSTS